MSITTTPRDDASSYVHTGMAPELTDAGGTLTLTIAHATHTRGGIIEVAGRYGAPPRAIGIHCGTLTCIEMALDGEWPGVVPARTDLIISAWPAPGDECSCAQLRCDHCGERSGVPMCDHCAEADEAGVLSAFLNGDVPCPGCVRDLTCDECGNIHEDDVRGVRWCR